MGRQLPENSSEGLEHSKSLRRKSSDNSKANWGRNGFHFSKAMSYLHHLFPSLSAKHVILLVLSVILLGALIFRINAKSFGTSIGKKVGTAIGSLEGMTKGRSEGTAAGKAAGLSAEDVETDIVTQIKAVGKLEVLVASVKNEDYLAIGGEEGDPDYAALFLASGKAIFTVDLSKAEFSPDGDTICITLPKPEGKLYTEGSSEGSVKIIAEYQKHSYSGSTEDGRTARINSIENNQIASESTINNYDVLLEAAISSAKTQVEQLAKSVSISYSEIKIEFRE